MLFRLHNGTLITLDDNLIHLSEWLDGIVQESRPLCLLAEALKKSQYKRVKAFFIKALEDLVEGPLSDEDLKLLSNPESKLSQALKEKFRDQPERTLLEGALEYTHANIDTIFEPVIHNIKFLSDTTLMHVIEFLQIPCTQRGENMFDLLPTHMQGCAPGTDIKTIMDPAFHSYMDFIQKIDIQPLMNLAKAACQLGIKPLVVLVGCRFAAYLTLLDEKTMRKSFNISEKFTDSVMEKLRSLIKRKPWMQAAAPPSKGEKTMTA